ncbi:MAG: MFS transporter [Acidobacteriota bacterium]|nr:MFS transporter [Acidobacteriota bacterium]
MIPLRRNRDFILLQSGQVLSTIGSESTAIAYPLLVLAVTHSPAKAGVVGFLRILPWALFGFAAGVVTDRLPRKRVMITGDIVRVLLMASVVAAVALGHITFVQILLVAFVEGSMYVFFNIAEIGALRSVVPPQQLPTAAAAEQARYSTVTLVAPTLGGALFGVGRMFPFLAGAISPGFSLGSLLAIRTPFERERTADDAPWRTQLAEGFRFLWARPFLRTCALLFTWTNLAFEGIVLAFIVIARRQGLSSTEIGLLIAAFGACSLVGSAASPWIQKRLSMRAIVVSSLWLQVATIGFVVDPSVYVLIACSVPMALFFPTVNAVVIGYRVAVTPERLTGRVNSVARTIALCGAPLGPLAAGLMLGALSARETIAVLTGILAVLAVLASLLPSIRNAPTLDELATLPLTEPVVPEAVG